ncbi:MAG: orotate phosphoribosyltransferase [Oscillospiraceae bacterium]|jgi:orotate phosphoribosyltransferase|nr:orotate phosphoribosyltransferase [Oscillospiraceae bacterium]
MEKKKLAEDLLNIGAIFLRPQEPFTWASGIKSPIYCDNRVVLSFPQIRDNIEKRLSENVKKFFPKCEMLAGTSTAGIAHAAFVAQNLNLPMVYVRSSEKDHGRKNFIEGKISPGQNTVVIEDLISTAGSAIKVVKILREAKVNVLGIISIFTYNMKEGISALENEKIKNFSLLSYDDLLEIAIEKGIVSKSDIKKLQVFKNNPKDSSWINLA